MPAEWIRRIHVPQGFPTPSTDAAPTSVFLVLFLASAVAHMFLFQKNKKRGHFFAFNGMCFGFSMSRVVTTSLRLGWMYNIENRGLGIAATIFVSAGVLLLFAINLFFAQRILRGLHPHLGWHKSASWTFKGLLFLIAPLLAMVVTATVQSFYTTDRNIAKIDLNMQRGASSYFLFLCFLPIPVTLFALFWPKSVEADHFGKGKFWHKSAVVIAASAILCLGAAFRVGTIFITWKPTYTVSPPWYNAKWCFYFFNFTLEIVVLVMFLFVRIDLLFHVPNGSKGAGSYSRGHTEEKQTLETRSFSSSSSNSSETLQGIEDASKQEVSGV